MDSKKNIYNSSNHKRKSLICVVCRNRVALPDDVFSDCHLSCIKCVKCNDRIIPASNYPVTPNLYKSTLFLVNYAYGTICHVCKDPNNLIKHTDMYHKHCIECTTCSRKITDCDNYRFDIHAKCIKCWLCRRIQQPTKLELLNRLKNMDYTFPYSPQTQSSQLYSPFTISPTDSNRGLFDSRGGDRGLRHNSLTAPMHTRRLSISYNSPLTHSSFKGDGFIRTNVDIFKPKDETYIDCDDEIWLPDVSDDRSELPSIYGEIMGKKRKNSLVKSSTSNNKKHFFPDIN
jgi:hypothetical protein